MEFLDGHEHLDFDSYDDGSDDCRCTAPHPEATPAALEAALLACPVHRAQEAK